MEEHPSAFSYLCSPLESDCFISQLRRCLTVDLAIFCTPCRYFLHIWPELAFLAYDSGHCLGTVVCKMDRHKCTNMVRGYLAMLVVEKPYRALGVGEWGCHEGRCDSTHARGRCEQRAGDATLQLWGPWTCLCGGLGANITPSSIISRCCFAHTE